MNSDRRKQLREQYKQRTVIGGIYRIRCTANDRFLMDWDDDLTSAENRHNFSVMTGTGMTGSIVPAALAADWKAHGPQSFVFERLEELEKDPDQSREEFYSDLKTLLELWREKVDPEKSYKK